ncbi:hypothetical protein BSKO_03541 [Bryopsis sp. KO-2023]|nr:hypothetical protein BSKO_03541 [Bryopsis sp. KO-2023]
MQRHALGRSEFGHLKVVRSFRLARASALMRPKVVRGQAPRFRDTPRGGFATACSTPPNGGGTEGRQRVVEGDIVTVHYVCRGPDNEVLDSSRDRDESISFEVGAGDVVGNKLFQGFDEAVRGLQKGESVELEATGADWKKELLFRVPRDHAEIVRLEGRYKNHGGLKEGLLVELANGQMAVVIHVDDEVVGLDANSMMAGKLVTFELEVVNIQAT